MNRLGFVLFSMHSWQMEITFEQACRPSGWKRSGREPSGHRSDRAGAAGSIADGDAAENTLMRNGSAAEAPGHLEL
jgi:hypothetical protein